MGEGEQPFDDGESLEDEDREQLQQDLVDVQVLKELLGPKGIKGTVFYCPDCGEDHFLTWELLTGNLRQLLDIGESPVHEPAFAPNPDEYVSWDYARGYLDGYESFEEEELSELTAKLVGELTSRGWRSEEIRSLVAALNLDFPGEDPRVLEDKG